ncbi:hypothetical protein ACFO60_22570 [Sphaerisporangium dianthi]|uniref:Uncharacterized protein n=2 Tax=Sphaerisporangium dianthi TaxID=1436120 RepID=A0ABV9CKJ5_9ACTN
MKRMSASLLYLVAAAVLLGIAALSLAFAWHIFAQDSRVFALSLFIAIAAVRWLAVTGIGCLIFAISAPFSATSPWASAETADHSPRSGHGGWYAEGSADFGDDGGDVDF